MDPLDLTRWLNGYLNEMSEILLEHGGNLDKYEESVTPSLAGKKKPGNSC